MPPSFANSRDLTYQEIGTFVAAARRAIAKRRDGRKAVIYPFAGVDFVGHLWFDAHLLRSLFPAETHQVFVMALPPSPRVDRRMVALAMRGLEVVDDIDLSPAVLFRAASTIFHDQSRFDFGDLHVLFGGASRSIREHYHPLHRGKAPKASVVLTEEEDAEGSSLASRLGIDPDRPLVVLHVRSPGYNEQHVFNRFRDCTVANYTPAIEMLARRGYSVLRIGDPSMPPLSVSGAHIHDSAHMPERPALLDVWAIARSAFMIHCCSGPTDIARSFARPWLGINGYLGDFNEFEANHVMLPKRMEEISTGRPLDLAEMLRQRLTTLWHADQLDGLGIRMVEAEPAEIEAATHEFLGHLAAWPTEVSRYESFAAEEGALRRSAGGRFPEDRFWAMDIPGSKLSRVFLDRVPEFLDRPPPPIADRMAPPPPIIPGGI